MSDVTESFDDPAEGDRLNWIFDAGRSGADLAETYDQWAEGYDADNEAWGWAGPDEVASVLARLGPESLSPAGPILDAGCGTGAVGAALRRAGIDAGLLGADLSGGMLQRAAEAGNCGRLVRCSLDRLPLTDGSVSAVISSGVFTHGHVGPEALVELCRVTASGGLVLVTQRLDVIDRYRPAAKELEDSGNWRLVEATEPKAFHPDRDESADEQALQTILTWQVI